MGANLKGWQVLRVLRHLKHTFGGAKISVPYFEIKQFAEGYVELKVKKFKHQYPDGKIEWIECEYQPVDKLFALVAGEILMEHSISPQNVEELYFVLGGDHGQEAFRLCFRVIIQLRSGDLKYRDYGGAGLAKGKDD